MQMEGATRNALPGGTILNEVYTIESELGHGGFGIVYRARHQVLGLVAIKEYLPLEFALREGKSVNPLSTESQGYFEEGMDRFLGEARQLVKFRIHPSIVSCRDFFRANGTAYLVMDFEEGLPLSRLLQVREAEGRPFDEPGLLGVMIPLLEGLAWVHAAGVLHRDIKPGNILIRKEDGSPVLIDFGAAKQLLADKSKSMAPFSPNYAAMEQVGDGQLGSWTDLYAIGAVMWRMVAGGNRPYEPLNPVRVERRALARVRGEQDPMPPARELGAGRFSENILAAIDRCLELRESDRIQNCGELLKQLRGNEDNLGSIRSKSEQLESEREVVSSTPLEKTVRRFAGQGGLWESISWSAKVRTSLFVTIGLLAVALVWWLGSSKLTDIHQDLTTATFTVDPEPAGAVVALLDSQEPYRPGMDLVPGKYKVEVSAPGYETMLEVVKHGETPTRRRIALKRNMASFTVQSVPARAKIALLNSQEQYRPGMDLVPGEYQVEVSAPGYETMLEVVKHGETPTRRRIALKRIMAAFTVNTEPAGARVVMLDNRITYQAGMRLVPGTYQVKVSADGYETVIDAIGHGEISTLRRIVLQKRRFPYEPEMVVVPAGQFWMGCEAEEDCEDQESPGHEVNIASFAISKYEVTFEEYDPFVDSTEQKRESDASWGRGRHPSINVSWEDAVAYTKWLSNHTGKMYRLPSEAEWEYVVRAGSRTAFNWGNEIGFNQANCNGCGSQWDGEQTAPVGSFSANRWGLHDMHGNVREWVADCWNDNYQDAPTNGSPWESGDCDFRVLRGGSWDLSPNLIRSSHRSRDGARRRSRNGGFRVARTIAP